MASVNGHNSKAYDDMIQARIGGLRKEIQSKRAKRDALDAEISASLNEIRGLETAYPHLFGSVRNPVANPKTKRLNRRETADVVVEILMEKGIPLHYREIHDKLVERGVALPESGDPASAFLARYFNDPRLNRIRPGTYAAGLPPNEEETHSPKSGPKNHPKPVSFTLLGEKRSVNTWIDVLRGICEELYKLDEKSFRLLVMPLETSDATPFFSLKQGDSRGDWEIPNTGVYVAGGLSSKDIIGRCKKILGAMGIDPESDFDIELAS